MCLVEEEKTDRARARARRYCGLNGRKIVQTAVAHNFDVTLRALDLTGPLKAVPRQRQRGTWVLVLHSHSPTMTTTMMTTSKGLTGFDGDARPLCRYIIVSW